MRGRPRTPRSPERAAKGLQGGLKREVSLADLWQACPLAEVEDEPAGQRGEGKKRMWRPWVVIAEDTVEGGTVPRRVRS